MNEKLLRVVGYLSMYGRVLDHNRRGVTFGYFHTQHCTVEGYVQPQIQNVGCRRIYVVPDSVEWQLRDLLCLRLYKPPIQVLGDVDQRAEV